MSIKGFKSFVCCEEDHSEDPHEMELLKEVPCGELRSLDDSNHWRAELVAVSSEGKEADPSDGQFEFGGEASSWLAVEPNVFSLSSRSEDEQTGDESVHMSSSSDVTSGETAQQSSPHDLNKSVAEAEINAMLESTTDPVGKVCHTFIAPLRKTLTSFFFAARTVLATARTVREASGRIEDPPNVDQRTEDHSSTLRAPPRAVGARAHAALQGPQPRARQGHETAQESVRAGK